MARKLSAQDRFFAKVDKTDTCWNWTAKKVQNGYGQMWFEGAHNLAHRLSYEWFVGEITGGLSVDHMCHNRACVNPGHLRLVTPKQNVENQTGAHSNSISGLRGVRYHRRNKRWWVEVVHNGKSNYGGSFNSPEEAAEAARLKRIELFTHNDIDRVA